MKIISKIIISTLVADVISRPELDYFQECRVTVQDLSGVECPKIFYEMAAVWFSKTKDAIINLRETKANAQFSDESMKGGCIKLWQFPSSDYKRVYQASNVPIAVLSDQKQKWRYISFIISNSDMRKNLVISQKQNTSTHTGYYAIAYYLAGILQHQFTYFFQFSIIMNSSSQDILATDLETLTPFGVNQCSGGQQQLSGNADSLIKWCSDYTCTTNQVPELKYNDQFFLQQIVTTPSLTNYYLTNTTVYYKGDGLNFQTKVIYYDNQIPGQVTLLLSANILWNNIAIQVVSHISTTASGKSEFTSPFDSVSGTTVTLVCFKLNSTSCPTCDEQCNINHGRAATSCPLCKQTWLIDESNFGFIISSFFVFIIL